MAEDWIMAGNRLKAELDTMERRVMRCASPIQGFGGRTHAGWKAWERRIQILLAHGRERGGVLREMLEEGWWDATPRKARVQETASAARMENHSRAR